jgi:hypothetical protein
MGSPELWESKLPKKTTYPSDAEKCTDVPSFLKIVAGLRARWRDLGLPAQSDKKRPFGEEKALWFRQGNRIWNCAGAAVILLV